MKNIELLAPAGNMDNLKVALNSGADAIYLGTKQFNARGKVQNFDFEELKQATSLAHLYNARVYVTINTLIFDEEIQDIFEVVRKCIQAKVDAFIVQDLGLAYALKQKFKGIELHASTQMGINNVAGAKIAQKLGFSRIVLSRETPLEEIKKIHEQTNLEIEYFIQGALCVCFSGNCYASGVLFGESGNRGRCLQLCRLPYTASKNGKKIKSGYLLSAKDFNMSKRLKDLIDAGVTSLKIEGRARREGYVAAVVSTYRQILDNNLVTTEKHQQTLQKAFNRGDFTQGYFNGNGNIIDNNIQGHKGLKIGKIIDFKFGNKFNTITILSKHKLNKNDGLKIINNQKEVCSFSAMDLTPKTSDVYVINTKAKATVGDSVYLIQDTAMEKQLAQNKKWVDVFAKFVAKVGHNAELTLSTHNGVFAAVQSEQPAQQAKTIPLDKQQVFSQIAKTQETVFRVANVEVELENVFITKQTLNQMRRQCIDKLQAAILDNYQQKMIEETEIDFDKQIQSLNKPQKAIIVSETSQVADNYDALIFAPTVYSTEVIKTMLGKYNTQKPIYLSVPALMDSVDEVIVGKIFEAYPQLLVYGNNISAFSYNRQVFASPLMNISNSLSAYVAQKLGAQNICLNFEISKQQAQNIAKNSQANIYVYSQGHMPLMTFAHCPMKNNFDGNCQNCAFDNTITYALQSGQKLSLSRYKMAKCYFSLKSETMFDVKTEYNQTTLGQIFDKS